MVNWPRAAMMPITRLKSITGEIIGIDM